MKNVRLLQGNEACALGALKAGARFFGGYPITPSTEIAEHMSVMMPQNGGVFMQMEDEIASISSVIGASSCGAKAFTATSGPGFSLMQEAIGYAAIAEIPIVIVDVQRMGPSTGLPTLAAQGDVQQARWGTHGDHAVIVLTPASVLETYYLTIEAFNMAEKYRTPVILLMDEEIGHLREKFDIDDEEPIEIIDRKKPTCSPEEYVPFTNGEEDEVPPMASFGEGYRYHITGLTHNQKGFYSSNLTDVDQFNRRLTGKIENHVDEIFKYESINAEDCDILLVSYGCSARSAHETVEILNEEGYNAGLLRLVTLWPVGDEKIKEICKGKKAVFVAELNLGQYTREIKRILGDSVPVHSFCRVDSELLIPEEMAEGIKEVLA